MAALVLLGLGGGVAVVLATSNSTSSSRAGAGSAAKRRPPPPVEADAALGTVRCSDSACRQGEKRVEPPIEGSPCNAQARAGEWSRIDPGSATPLFACVPASDPPDGAAPADTVPDVEGARLDLAEGYLDKLGLEHQSSGGGFLGIVDRQAWTVCATRPEPRADAPGEGEPVKLFVDRSC